MHKRCSDRPRQQSTVNSAWMLTDAGYLNLDRFEKFLEALSKVEYEEFEDHFADMKWFQSKQEAGKEVNDLSERVSHLGINKAPASGFQKFDQERLASLQDDLEEDEDLDIEEEEDDDSEDDPLVKSEFKQHKRHYYMKKLEYAEVTAEVLREQAECYVRAIQWNLHYYYHGVCSWSWFYPHHYAPYISDIKGFSGLNLDFDAEKPFLPFEQLLAVLPAARYLCLIDRLLKAMRPLSEKLTIEEQERNKHGPALLFHYSQSPKGPYETPGYFAAISNHHAIITPVHRESFFVPPDKLVKGLCPNVRLDVYFPGFPTLKHIPHKGYLKSLGVKVFQQNSRGENMILEIQNQGSPNIAEVARDLLGHPIFVSWPHLIEAKVIGVCNEEWSLHLQGKEIVQEKMSQQEVALVRSTVKMISEHQREKRGIEIGETKIMIRACPLIGRKYTFGHQGRITLEKQFAHASSSYALQTTVKDIAFHDPSFTQFKTLEDIFSKGSTCFMLAQPHYGCMGEVIEVESVEGKSGKVRVLVTDVPEPDLSAIKKKKSALELPYVPGYQAAQKLGISSHLLSRLTGSIYIIPGSKDNHNPNGNRINFGLNLKFNRKNEEVEGFTRKDRENVWLYSSQAIAVIKDYLEAFPDLFEFLADNTGNDIFFASDIFPTDVHGMERVKEIVRWLKEQPSSSAPRRKCGSRALDAKVVAAIEEKVRSFTNEPGRKARLVVKPHLLFRPHAYQGSLPPDPSTSTDLFDRIINVRQGFSVPLGLRGTVVGPERAKMKQPGYHAAQEKHHSLELAWGFHVTSCLSYPLTLGMTSAEKPEEVLYEVVFDQEFPGGVEVRCSGKRGYKIPASAFLNFSHGIREEAKRRQQVKPLAVVHPRSSDEEPLSLPLGRHHKQGGSTGMVVRAGRPSYRAVPPPPSLQFIPPPPRFWTPRPMPPARQMLCDFPPPSQPLVFTNSTFGAGRGRMGPTAGDLRFRNAHRNADCTHLQHPDLQGQHQMDMPIPVPGSYPWSGSGMRGGTPHRPPHVSTNYRYITPPFQSGPMLVRQGHEGRETAQVDMVRQVHEEKGQWRAIQPEELFQSAEMMGKREVMGSLTSAAQPLTNRMDRATAQLMEYFQGEGKGGVPRYKYVNGPGGFQASVTLPDGSTFDGPVSAFKDEAAEGAAMLALVKVKAPPRGTSDPPAPGAATDAEAVGLLNHLQIHRGSSGEKRGSGRIFQAALRGAHDRRGDDSLPFVPLQVAKKSVASSREGGSRGRGMKPKASSSESQEGLCLQDEKKDTARKKPVCARSISESSSPRGPSGQRKCRLAINFANAPKNS
ncbi:unnamed protein product [Darwinula stevensoni]|uniref:Uncharacterized protein n=1 Tax=Darwinula stevensoni TaxID=69355 RepID=A0A7R8X4E5_9CRUS|nr:unnamed protein product [Darwinula stevensoni]CAG0878937.1 unnamed protein product [Darwinula stevensoni]